MALGYATVTYRKVEHGKVATHIDYLTADREEAFVIAQANSPIKENGHFGTDRVVCRGKGDFIDVEPAHVDYMDVSPKQLVSVAASLIPFLTTSFTTSTACAPNAIRKPISCVRCVTAYDITP